ncbi:MAG TPA: hypothetical protein VNN80_05730, partial [Polyangiaceae bacterium]|nr:hypothetical protein [Polyangiaceae bacterium]
MKRMRGWIPAILLLACSGGDERAPRAAAPPESVWTSNTDTTPIPVAPPTCEDWATRDCAIEMRTRGSLVDCAPGVQTCQNGTWSSCVIDASRDWFTVPAPSASSQASAGALGLQSIGGDSQSCADNVCNPYCQYYEDVPAEPIEADRVDTPTGYLYGGSLAGSNVPTAFKGKGSLDEQCSATAGSALWNEACQFDQHCVAGKCVAFQPDESGSCTGVDITAPTTCVMSSGGTRAITVCNRGTEAAPAGIKCYTYSGGSPQFPNSNPGLGSLVYTTSATIEPGACETAQVAESIWGQNGIQSVACNPPESVQLDVSVGPKYPSSNATPSGSLPWASAANAGAADGSNASATPANPAGASTGAVSPTANAAFGSDGTWSNPTNAYSLSPAGSYATAAPVAPVAASGSMGPNYGASSTTPATSSETSFNNPGRANASDGSYATATPANPEVTLAGVAT